jgi:hypothetical protein
MMFRPAGSAKGMAIGVVDPCTAGVKWDTSFLVGDGSLTPMPLVIDQNGVGYTLQTNATATYFYSLNFDTKTQKYFGQQKFNVAPTDMSMNDTATIFLIHPSTSGSSTASVINTADASASIKEIPLMSATGGTFTNVTSATVDSSGGIWFVGNHNGNIQIYDYNAPLSLAIPYTFYTMTSFVDMYTVAAVPRYCMRYDMSTLFHSLRVQCVCELSE